MSDWVGIPLTLLLLLLNAFFVGAEFSLISSRKDRLESLVAQGKKSAKVVLKASEHLSLMLAACQLGITIASILLGKVGEPAIAHLLEIPMHAAGLPDYLLHPVSFVIAIAIVVYLHVLLGEMVPKNIAIAGPETMAMIIIPPHLVFSRLTKPVIHFCNWAANSVLRGFGVEPKDEMDSSVTSSELSAMLVESRSEGLLEDDEHQRLTRTLANTERRVTEVMIKWNDVRRLFSSNDEITFDEIEKVATETGFSRYPVVDAADNPIGYVHIKDVFEVVVDAGIDANGGHTDSETSSETKPQPRAIVRSVGKDRIHRLPHIASTLGVQDALATLRRTGSHLGAVIDENSSTVGIVALEDLLEEFVGTVRDGTHRIGRG